MTEISYESPKFVQVSIYIFKLPLSISLIDSSSIFYSVVLIFSFYFDCLSSLFTIFCNLIYSFTELSNSLHAILFC